MTGGLLRPLRARLSGLGSPLNTGLDRLCRPTDAGLSNVGDPIQASIEGYRPVCGAALIGEGVAARTVGGQFDPRAGCEGHMFHLRRLDAAYGHSANRVGNVTPKATKIRCTAAAVLRVNGYLRMRVAPRKSPSVMFSRCRTAVPVARWNGVFRSPPPL